MTQNELREFLSKLSSEKQEILLNSYKDPLWNFTIVRNKSGDYVFTRCKTEAF